MQVYVATFGWDDCDGLATLVVPVSEFFDNRDSVEARLLAAMRDEAIDAYNGADDDDPRTVDEIMDSLWLADSLEDSSVIGLTDDILEEAREDGYVWI